MALLAAEITAVTGKTPTQRYSELTDKFGASVYERIDAPATLEQKSKLGKLSATDVSATYLAGEQITAILDTAEPFKEVSERPIKKVPALRGKTIVNLYLDLPTGREAIPLLDVLAGASHRDAPLRSTGQG